MDVPLEPHRELCLTCRRPKSVCWCDAVTKVPSQTHVVFIQHPREARVPISTCRMAHLSLPNSELHIGLGAVGNDRLEALCREQSIAVLFPSDGAADVETLTDIPRTLVVVDGTWSNAKKVVEKCPLLSTLPRLKFRPDTPGNYRIRKEPTDLHYSTIEAVSYVLERLEKSPGRFRNILSAFDAMVDKQLAFVEATGNQSRHRRKVKRNSVKVDALAPLKLAASKVVVFGESNAWPMADPLRPPGEAELLQLVAIRLETNETFNAVLQHTRPLSPSAPLHLDLPADVLERSEARAEAMARWRAFLKPDDTLIGWGGYCEQLLTDEGCAPATFLNLRTLLAQKLKGRPGSVEAVAEKLGATLPNGEGRAMRRLRALEVATKHALTL